MPIDIESFEEGSAEHLGTGPTQPERVLVFLARHADQAFRPREIAGATDIPDNSINAVLARLEERRLVRHKGRYWAITDDVDRLQSISQYELVTRGLNDLYGEEEFGEWADLMPMNEEGSNDAE